MRVYIEFSMEDGTSQGRRKRGAIAPHFLLILKKLKLNHACWLAKLSSLKHTHGADSDCDKKTLAHYNSYL